MAEICSITHSSDQFETDVQRRTMTTELSMLTEGGTRKAFSQVYDDACDEGFCILSKSTGKTATFAIDREDRDREGELQAIELVPTQETLRRTPQLQGWRVIVFND